MRLHLLVLASLLTAGSASLLADPIPYQNPGHILTGSTTITANGGDISAYFVSYNAGDTDTLYLVDLATNQTFKSFQNNASIQGDSTDFGSFAAGTPLAFEIVNSNTGDTYSTDTALNPDNADHTYVVPGFAGGFLADGNGNPGTFNFPAGTYVAFEDLPIPNPSAGEPDYNDLAFVFTNVTATPTPEPSSFLLLGTGLIGAAGALRRKFAR
jgi:PEP-CTERM motif/Domain of unknown function (DUF4114)